MSMGITTRETIHNYNWRLPAGERVLVKPATNLPDDCSIKYWVMDFNGLTEDDYAQSIIRNEGIGLRASDIRITH